MKRLMPNQRSGSQLKSMNALSYLGFQTLNISVVAPELKYKVCAHAGLSQGWLQHMPELATSRKWTHTVQTRRRGGQSSVLQCQTE